MATRGSVRPEPGKRVAVGQLLHSRKEPDGTLAPLRHVKVELWDLDRQQGGRLQVGRTDDEGRFELHYDPDLDMAFPRWFGNAPDLQLRVLDREFFYDEHGKHISRWEVVATVHAQHGPGGVDDFGERHMTFWEIEDPEHNPEKGFTPRVRVVQGNVPQAQRPGRVAAQTATALLVADEYAQQRTVNHFQPQLPTLAQITQAYDDERAGRDVHLWTESDEDLVDLILNGFNPCPLQVDPAHLTDDTGARAAFVAFRFDGLEVDDRHFVAHTKANLRITGPDVELVSIEVQKRHRGGTSAHTPLRPAVTYTPASAQWERVKRLFRVNYFAFGEVVTHLSQTHLNLEQYILPLRRNVHLNPIGRLLRPHLYGTVAVNQEANAVLLDDSSIVQLTSPLTSASARAAVQTSFGTYNWYGFRPRTPLGPKHRYARAGQAMWAALTEYVEEFFAANDAEIREHWVEMRWLSEELISRSLPYVRVSAARHLDAGELNTPDKPHPLVRGRRVALSPVTAVDVPGPDDLERAKQLCRYILYIATFVHSWVNDRQFEMGHRPELCTLGVTDDLTNLGLKDFVPAREAIEHPFMTFILSFTEHGYLARNEDGDVNPALMRAVMKHKDELENNGMPVRRIRSTINI